MILDKPLGATVASSLNESELGSRELSEAYAAPCASNKYSRHGTPVNNLSNRVCLRRGFRNAHGCRRLSSSNLGSETLSPSASVALPRRLGLSVVEPRDNACVNRVELSRGNALGFSEVCHYNSYLVPTCYAVRKTSCKHKRKAWITTVIT